MAAAFDFDRLKRLYPKAIDLNLDRITRLMAALGHPERRLPPVVHIAGTNGKGSVIAFLRAILEAAGYRVHVYTSPHLVRFNERIRLAGHLIDDGRLAAMLGECEAANAGRPITFFEITTACAFLAFARTRADIALIETGLGGRLDATNLVARPLLTAITPISLDHQQYLGTRLDRIAAEKAAILKPGVPAVSGPQPKAAAAVIEATAKARGTPLWRAGGEWSLSACGDGFVYQSRGRRLWLPQPGLLGPHQRDNAAIAIAAIERVPAFRIPAPAIVAGLTRVSWPARLQRIPPGKLTRLLAAGAELWLDGGHNAAAGAALAETIRREWRARPLSIICGMLNSKSPEAFLRPLAGAAENLWAVAIPGERNSLGADGLAECARGLGFAAAPADSLAEAVRRAGGPRRPRRILICGSLYLAGAVLGANGAGAPA